MLSDEMYQLEKALQKVLDTTQVGQTLTIHMKYSVLKVTRESNAWKRQRVSGGSPKTSLKMFAIGDELFVSPRHSLGVPFIILRSDAVAGGTENREIVYERSVLIDGGSVVSSEEGQGGSQESEA